MMYGSELVPICYIIHELRKKSGREFQEYMYYYISAHCLLYSNQSTLRVLLFTKQTEHGDWCPRMKTMILIAWIQCLAGAVDCGVYTVLRTHCKPLDKVIILRPA
jgi:hypothetical protein